LEPVAGGLELGQLGRRWPQVLAHGRVVERTVDLDLFAPVTHRSLRASDFPNGGTAVVRPDTPGTPIHASRTFIGTTKKGGRGLLEGNDARLGGLVIWAT